MAAKPAAFAGKNARHAKELIGKRGSVTQERAVLFAKSSDEKSYCGILTVYTAASRSVVFMYVAFCFLCFCFCVYIGMIFLLCESSVCCRYLCAI